MFLWGEIRSINECVEMNVRRVDLADGSLENLVDREFRSQRGACMPLWDAKNGRCRVRTVSKCAEFDIEIS